MRNKSKSQRATLFVSITPFIDLSSRLSYNLYIYIYIYIFFLVLKKFKNSIWHALNIKYSIQKMRNERLYIVFGYSNARGKIGKFKIPPCSAAHSPSPFPSLIFFFSGWSEFDHRRLPSLPHAFLGSLEEAAGSSLQNK